MKATPAARRRSHRNPIVSLVSHAEGRQHALQRKGRRPARHASCFASGRVVDVAVTEYVRWFEAGARKRHRHETHRGQVVSFTVQLEIETDDGWTPVVRYDMAHGSPHIDRYVTPGRPTKTPLDLSPAQALTHADKDLDANWCRYRGAFLEGRQR